MIYTKAAWEETFRHNHLGQIAIREELDWICGKLGRQLEKFGNRFPSSCATNGKYRLKDNDDWTNGFWTGMLWMAYEYSKDNMFRDAALQNIQSFQQRLELNLVLDHHDIGFLYTLSVGAGHKIMQDPMLLKVLVAAAEKLAARYQEKGRFIQAWGRLDDPNEYRLIVDSLMNLPLLFYTSDKTGVPKYREIAESHFRTLISTIVREDASTYHTFFFHPENGMPAYGATHQGYSDNSCWARGQAWAVAGLPLVYRYSPYDQFAVLYEDIANYFLTHLPDDIVPYWDLSFDAGSNEPRDTSALAIAVCGLLETAAFSKGAYREKLVRVSIGMLSVLRNGWTSKEHPDMEGILLHGIYAYAEGKGMDEPNLWGDYFYMEALYRLYNPAWKTYW
ncbi:unsaturated glucuronyl hydrolase Ugl [Paenibacillus larvae subsp. larvae]|uniref:Unsaturated glucuronyl hydrolase Ugl n=1 Tax=Paenibacillus larvae subsp. larvae TaxID=147375 RepID=A0A2L1U2K9_9BACL|nr:glycoside hydrolase family 88 protein [Paenibacillus larvae]AQZ45225.1 glucuronyl hydrolase [Paenibacillus larvae subsp. pulvifaciens]AVF27152.1 unsaturated glucuronyl hydrolase Ugl [Paenibacillus larvae subsp. larvae]AVF31813.1 unsaturated glucuronyl hydrolase Ugl [Paenibacillus larvae subsp. larvae]MCY7520203.1 glycoside hydrolase family 88 protein [Paenibacillus larvae]MCY9501601.1 glycoside hydrolase family 88 protein [Paenibacillus larvae]